MYKKQVFFVAFFMCVFLKWDCVRGGGSEHMKVNATQIAYVQSQSSRHEKALLAEKKVNNKRSILFS